MITGISRSLLMGENSQFNYQKVIRKLSTKYYGHYKIEVNLLHICLKGVRFLFC